MRLISSYGCALASTLALTSTAAAYALPPQVTPAVLERIVRATGSNGPWATELLRSLVNIDSPSDDIEDGRRISTLLTETLAPLGAEITIVPSEAPGKYADNLVARFRGRGRGRILIIAHADTVFPKGTAALRPFSVEGGRATGPGVGDEKAGIVVATSALKILHDLRFADYREVVLLVDGSEESGSPGSRKLIDTLAGQCDAELNMEPGDPPDSVTVWRKGSAVIKIGVEGKAAHAGMDPQDGRNAAVELIHQLDQMQAEFPHSGDELTANLTLMKAGERENIIPDKAAAGVNIRYRNTADLKGALTKLEANTRSLAIAGTKVSVTQMSGYPPMVENGKTDALYGQAADIYHELDKSLGRAGSGGASESALAAAKNVAVLDGLGAVGGGFHSDQEWIDLSSIGTRTYLVTRLIMKLGHEPPG